MFTKQNGISEIGDCNELVAKNNQLQKKIVAKILSINLSYS